MSYLGLKYLEIVGFLYHNNPVYIFREDVSLLFDLQSILDRIEFLRGRMEELAAEKGITHPSVLRISQMLDVEIVKYHKIRKKVSLDQTVRMNPPRKQRII